MKFLVTSSLIALLAMPSLATAADKHTVTLNGPIKVGTTFRSHVERSHAMLENRAELAAFQGQTTLSAVVKVTAVDGDGQITGAELTIEDFADAPMQGAIRTLPTGSKVTVERKGKRFKVTDPSGKLDKEALQPLQRSKILSGMISGTPPWISGPGKPVTDGDTWTLDSKEIGKRMGNGMDKAKIAAKAWLNDVDANSYTVIGELKADGLSAANPAVKGIKTTGGKVAGQVTVTVAKDGKGPVLQLVDRRSIWMTITVKRDGKDVATKTVMNTTFMVRNTIL